MSTKDRPEPPEMVITRLEDWFPLPDPREQMRRELGEAQRRRVRRRRKRPKTRPRTTEP